MSCVSALRGRRSEELKVQTHSVHIPVMGTGFTIDTPLKVARYGISSVMSVDDNLMEKMRRYYSELYGESFTPIAKNEEDSRARRITAYLNFIHRAVSKQLEEIKAAPFEAGSEITKYFELLSEKSALKQKYNAMLKMESGDEKTLAQKQLRGSVVAGSIDINILTKLDRENFKAGEKMPREFSDALAALRGFASSDLSAAVVFSAGLNPYLYSYAENFKDFYPDEEGRTKKRIIIKVSDFRSAFIQGKIFSKKGIWVSEFRIESGINCGGHAFPTAGNLLGPILQEFKDKKESFTDELFSFYREALLSKKGIQCFGKPATRITVQGGVGTSQEDEFLIREYQLDGTGWGTPFLLVPEATSVDAETLSKLTRTNNDTLYLSNSSPLGVPIYSLRNSASEEARRERIKSGRPGSPCFNKYMAFNTEFSVEPICTASFQYQAKKIQQLKEKNLSTQEYAKEYSQIVEKACICYELGDGVLLKYGAKHEGVKAVPAVCPGPNLIYFYKICSLKEMMGHIYGKINILNPNRPRPHLFINELNLYINYFKGLIMNASTALTEKQAQYFSEFRKNLNDGIAYYKKLESHFLEETKQSRDKFLADLEVAMAEIKALAWAVV